MTHRTKEKKFKYQQMPKTAKPDKVPSQISTIDYDQGIALEKAKWLQTAEIHFDTEPFSNQK